MEFFAERSSFLGSLASCKLDQVQTPKQARVKRPRELSDNESDDAAERFERQPRVSSWSEPDLPQRLPVKSSDGRLMLSKVSQADKQSLQVKHGNKNDGSPVKVKEVLGEDEGPPPSTLKPQEPSETPQQRSQRLRIRIGVVCENICESPEENISLLDELFSMSKDLDPVIRELSILSQVYSHISVLSVRLSEVAVLSRLRFSLTLHLATRFAPRLNPKSLASCRKMFDVYGGLKARYCPRTADWSTI